MRVLSVILGLFLLLLQYRLWISDQGKREVWRLTQAVEAQAAANAEQRERNRQLLAEVTDLKVGLTALEERARSELGMVGNSETFYQIVSSAPAAPVAPAPAAPATSLTARAQ
jgi:cell division protein FtsB